MAQYYPTNRAEKNILLNRTIRHSEFDRVTELLHKYGLEKGWIQEMESHDFYHPNFNEDREDPFGNKKLFEFAVDKIRA
jgi:putative pyruvate formate lyase activating enzyme